MGAKRLGDKQGAMTREGKSPKSQQEDKKQKDSSLKIMHDRECLLNSEETHTQSCILAHSRAYKA